MALERRLAFIGPEPTFIDGPGGVRVAPDVFVTACYEIVNTDTGEVIAREMPHRWPISINTPDLTLLASDGPGTGPKMSIGACNCILEGIETIKAKYSIWEKPQA